MATPERLAQSFLGIAWKIGLPPPQVGAGMSPWSAVSIRYHYEEALVFRFWAMQAELKFGYVSKIMDLTEAELLVPVRASGIAPLDVLRAMTQWALSRAGQRARAVGSQGIISIDEAVTIYNARVTRYEALVSASVLESRPIPIADFQLGLRRDHPWTELLCFCADNLADSLNLDDEWRPIAGLVLQQAVSTLQVGLYQTLQAKT